MMYLHQSSRTERSPGLLHTQATERFSSAMITPPDEVRPDRATALLGPSVLMRLKFPSASANAMWGSRSSEGGVVGTLSEHVRSLGLTRMVRLGMLIPSCPARHF